MEDKLGKKCPNVAIVTFPIGGSGFTPLSNLVRIVQSLSDQVHLVTGNLGYSFFKEINQIHTYEIKHKKGTRPFSRVIRYILTQLKFIPILIGLANEVDFFLFFFGGESLLIPLLTAKFSRKKVALVLPASSGRISSVRKDIFYRFLKFLSEINCFFSDKILLCSEKLVNQYGLQLHRKKISIAHEHFVDFNRFKEKKRLNERDELVGYIGRLSEEKGILNFVEAIPSVLKNRGHVRFLIGGDGPLHGEIIEYLRRRNLEDKVKIVGWIPHNDMSKCLNDLKLLVVPSYTESGPLIAFEAMACGTPVLGSKVGMMSEILYDKNNGFVLENNSPELIANCISEILTRKDLSEISKNARKTVKNRLTYDSAVNSYKLIFMDLWTRNTLR